MAQHEPSLTDRATDVPGACLGLSAGRNDLSTQSAEVPWCPFLKIVLKE